MIRLLTVVASLFLLVVPVGAAPAILCYPTKVKEIKDSSVLSAYLRVIALANDELRKRIKLDDGAKVLAGKITLIIQPLSSAKQLSELIIVLNKEEESNGLAEYYRAFNVLEHAKAEALIKLVSLGTFKAKQQFLEVKKSWPRGDSGYGLILLRELEDKLNARLDQSNK